MPELTIAQWFILGGASAGIGFSKAGFPGVSMMHVVVFAIYFGPKQSTGILLPMLIVGDLCAIAFFGRRAVWPQIWRLLPPTLAGIVLGWFLMDRLNPTAFRWTVGFIILALSAIQSVRMLAANRLAVKQDETQDAAIDGPSTPTPHSASLLPALSLGVLAGMTTMMANAAGPVIAMYLLIAKLPKWELIGTAAWLFLVLNVIKLPFSYQLGLINPQTLGVGLVLIAAIPIGMAAGRWLVGRVSQQVFNVILLGFTALMALKLIAS